MGLSIQARRFIEKQAAERARRKAAEAAAAEQAAATFHRDFLGRERAAAACGVSVHKFKRWQSAGVGPVPTKLGSNKQSPVVWARAEVAAFVADPSGYNARRAASNNA